MLAILRGVSYLIVTIFRAVGSIRLGGRSRPIVRSEVDKHGLLGHCRRQCLATEGLDLSIIDWDRRDTELLVSSHSRR
jgi:hypothetical protein